MVEMNQSKNREITVVRRVCLFGGAFLLALSILVSNLSAGVLVAPSVIFLSQDNRTGRMTLQNTGDISQEVTVFFSFGLPQGDSLGDVKVELVDSNVTDPQSALGWVKAFPRRLILPPNASQVVRFVANPPREIEDGEYWCRVVVKSQDADAKIPVASEAEGITTKLNMVMQTAIMLKYRQGDIYTRLELAESEATQIDDKVQVMLNLKNSGNASYVGMLNSRLLDADGREISRNSVQLAVYHDLRRRVMLPIPPGDFVRPFKVEVEITGKGRTDIASKDMLFGNDISYSAVIE
jgi:P pilus assembly chaperone PapD